MKIDNQIKKELRKCYDNSRFHGYPIVLKGFLVLDKKNKTNLILYDIFLQDEYDNKIQSKRLSIRLENLKSRFLMPKLSLLKGIFSHPFSDLNVEMFIKLFVHPNMIDKIVYKKNIPKDFEDDDIIIEDIWTDYNGIVTGFIKDTFIKKEMNEDQKVTIETPIDYLKSFTVRNEDTNELVLIDLINFSESNRVEMLAHANEFINRKCTYRKYKILNKEGYIFENVI